MSSWTLYSMMGIFHYFLMICTSAFHSGKKSIMKNRVGCSPNSLMSDMFFHLDAHHLLVEMTPAAQTDPIVK